MSEAIASSSSTSGAFQNAFVNEAWIEFSKLVLSPLKDAAQNTQRINSAFQDILYVCDLRSYINPYQVLDSIMDDEGFEYKKNMMQHMQSVAILKAAYYFAVTYLDVFVRDIFKRKKGTTFRKFVERSAGDFGHKLRVSDVMPAYCICIYRNKIIAHHEEYRLDASSSSSDGHVELMPMGRNLTISEKDQKQLEELAMKYVPNAGLSDIETIDCLFDLIPVTSVGKVGDDRSAINSIAERNGCGSKTIQTIMTDLNRFSIAATQAVCHVS